jgi:hypothetical protein
MAAMSAKDVSVDGHPSTSTRDVGTSADVNWDALPEDVCKTMIRHLSLSALARFGAVCRVWHQVRTWCEWGRIVRMWTKF